MHRGHSQGISTRSDNVCYVNLQVGSGPGARLPGASGWSLAAAPRRWVPVAACWPARSGEFPPLGDRLAVSIRTFRGRPPFLLVAGPASSVRNFKPSAIHCRWTLERAADGHRLCRWLAARRRWLDAALDAAVAGEILNLDSPRAYHAAVLRTTGRLLCMDARDAGWQAAAGAAPRRLTQPPVTERPAAGPGCQSLRPAPSRWPPATPAAATCSCAGP